MTMIGHISREEVELEQEEQEWTFEYVSELFDGADGGFTAIRDAHNASIAKVKPEREIDMICTLSRENQQLHKQVDEQAATVLKALVKVGVLEQNISTLVEALNYCRTGVDVNVIDAALAKIGEK